MVVWIIRCRGREEGGGEEGLCRFGEDQAAAESESEKENNETIFSTNSHTLFHLFHPAFILNHGSILLPCDSKVYCCFLTGERNTKTTISPWKSWLACLNCFPRQLLSRCTMLTMAWPELRNVKSFTRSKSSKPNFTPRKARKLRQI